MKKIPYSLTLSILVFSVSFSFAGGGWPQPRGEGYFKLFQWWVIADQHFTDVGLIDPNVTNALYNTGVYAEYGLTDRLTGILYFPFFSRAVFNNQISATTSEIIFPGEALNSVGDTDIGLKYGLILNSPVVVSATLKFGLPLGNNNGGPMGRLQTGDGELNQIIRLDAGSGFQFGGTSAYTTLYAGFNNRTRGFSDEVRFGAEMGFGFIKNKLHTIFRLIGTKSLNNGDREEIANSTSVFADGAEFLSFSPEIAYSLNDQWGISAGYATAFSGKLIFANPSYSVGVFFKLKK